MRKTRPRKKSQPKSIFQNPVIVGTIITGVVTVVVTVLQVLPQLNLPEPKGSESPTATSSLTATFTPTILPTETESAEVESRVILTETPTPTPTPEPPSVTCLNGWWVVNTLKVPTTQDPREGCDASGVPELGISTSAEGFLVTLQRQRFSEIGIFGISSKARLPVNAEIELRVDAYGLYNAEFWIGLSNTPDMSPDTMILALDPALGDQRFQSGNIRIYRNNFNSELIGYQWPELNTQARQTPPFYYDIKLTITGGNVDILVNNIPLSSQVVNFPRYLFLGFRNKTVNGSVDIRVEVSKLTIETQP